MTASVLLTELHDRGVGLTLTGDDRLKIDAPKGAVTPELRNALVANKNELIAILQQQAVEVEEKATPVEKALDEVGQPVAEVAPVAEEQEEEGRLSAEEE